MGFTPKRKQPDFLDLKSTLAQTKAKKDDALYKTIQYLLERLAKFQTITNGDITDINESVNSITSTVNIVADKRKSYITVDDETLDLPKSRQLIAGVGVTLDTTTPHQIIINASGGCYIPMATGAEPLEIMSDGAGHILLVAFNV